MSGRSEIVSYSVAWCTETILEASQHEAWSCTLLKMGRFAEALWSSPNTKKHTPDEEARDTLAKTIRNQAEDGPSTRRAAVSSKKKLACRGPSTRPTALRLYETSSFLHRLQSGNLHLLQRLMQFPHNRQFDCFVCVGLFLGFCCCFWFVMTS